MAPVTPCEQHELDQRTVFCEGCADWTALAVHVAVVDGRDLLVLNRYTTVRCPCGWEDTYR